MSTANAEPNFASRLGEYRQFLHSQQYDSHHHSGTACQRYRYPLQVDKRKSASILDTFSCVIQGIIPYGAQMLIAAKLASLSPLSIIEYLYYPVAIGIFALLSIFLRYPRRYS